MSEPAVPSEGLGVVHLFWKVTPLADRDGILAAIKEATAADDQVVTVAMLGHKADLATMALGRDLWRLRGLQTALASAGLDLVDSYVSLTEVSEYAKGVPDEAKQARLYPVLPPEGKYAWCFYPMSKRRGHDDNWFTLEFDRRRDLMMEHGMSGRKFAGRLVQLITASTSGASRSSPRSPMTSRRSSTRCASTRHRPSTPNSAPSTPAWSPSRRRRSPPSASSDRRGGGFGATPATSVVYR